MGFFSNRYTREGPGVPKDAPPKKGLARFWEVLARDWGDLWKAGTLLVVCCIPLAADVYKRQEENNERRYQKRIFRAARGGRDA